MDHYSGMSHVELLPIPPTESATDPILSTADLRQRWRALMGPLGFGERLLRFVFVGPDRRFTTTLLDMPIPRLPDPDVLANLMPALAGVLAEREPGTTVACLITRPGPVTDIDRKWAMVVRAHAEHVDVPLEPIFRANDESVLQVETAA